MKATLILTALATAVLAMAPLRDAAAANDYKIHSGSECKVFGNTAWTDLHFSAAGIINLTNTPKNVLCPIVKDSEANWDSSAGVPVNPSTVHMHVRNGPVAARTVCTVYVVKGDSGGGVEDSSAFDTGVFGAGLETLGNASGLDSASINGQHSHALMLCTLGPRATLRFYYLFEQGASDT